jgi:hypothetical protein
MPGGYVAGYWQKALKEEHLETEDIDCDVWTINDKWYACPQETVYVPILKEI